MDRWQILFALASERQEQATFLKAVVDKLSVMETLVQETEDYLSFDRFTSASEFEQTVKLLKVSFCWKLSMSVFVFFYLWRYIGPLYKQNNQVQLCFRQMIVQ